MKMHNLLIEAHKHLDAATIEDDRENDAMVMYHLGALHGLLILFLETTPKIPCELDEPVEGS